MSELTYEQGCNLQVKVQQAMRLSEDLQSVAVKLDALVDRVLDGEQIDSGDEYNSIGV
jgi:hypothetical protein